MDWNCTQARPRPLRVVLLGNLGSGKSASGNTLLGTPCFSSWLSASPVTRECEAHTGTVGGRWVTVVDTPGLSEEMDSDAVKQKLLQCLWLSDPGPHVFLLVIRLGRFTQEEKDTVERAEKIFGQSLYRFTIILFTFEDILKKSSIEEYVRCAGESLKQVLRKCGSRYHAFNNDSPPKDQAEQLLVKIEHLVAANGGRWYTDTDSPVRGRSVSDTCCNLDLLDNEIVINLPKLGM